MSAEKIESAFFRHFATLKSALKLITVEPVTFLYMAAQEVSQVIGANGIFEKVCHETSKTVAGIDCASKKTMQKEVLQLVQSQVTTWTMLIAVGVITVLFVASPIYGSLSDKHGRKTIILIAIFGQVMSTFVYLLAISLVGFRLMWLVVALTALGVFGGIGTFNTTTSAYLADREADHSRLTVRYTIVQTVNNVGEIIASFALANAFSSISIQMAAVLPIAFNTVGFFYTLTFLVEMPPRLCRLKIASKAAGRTVATVETLLEGIGGDVPVYDSSLSANSKGSDGAASSTASFIVPVTNGQTANSNGSIAGNTVAPTGATSINLTPLPAQCPPPRPRRPRPNPLVTVRLLCEAIATVRKPRQGHFRAYIFVTIIVAFIFSFARIGGAVVFRLYILGHPLVWTAAEQSTFFGVQAAIQLVGGLFTGIGLKKIFHFHETTLLLIAIGSLFVNNLLIGLAQSSQLVYVAAASGFALPMLHVVARSLLTQFVDVDETGKVFGIFVIVIAASVLIGIGGLTTIFNSTLVLYPGLVFLLLAGVSFVAFLSVLWMHVDYMRYRQACLPSKTT